MTTRTWRALARREGAGLLFVAAAGCSSSSNSASPATAAREAGTDATAVTVSTDGAAEATEGGEDGGASTYALQWKIIVGTPAASDGGADASSADSGDFAADAGEFSSPPVPGVTVCVYQNPSIACATSADDGTFTLQGLAGGTNMALTLNKDGYVPTLIPIQTAMMDMDSRSDPLFLNSSSAPAPNVGIAVDWQDAGQIVAFAIGPSADGGNTFPDDPGAMISLSPMSGSGPFYQSSQGQYVLSATSYVGFYASYFNVGPGTYTLTYTDSKNDCEAINFPFSGWGFPISKPAHSVQVPVVAGYLTGAVGVLCTPNSVIVSTDGG